MTEEKIIDEYVKDEAEEISPEKKLRQEKQIRIKQILVMIICFVVAFDLMITCFLKYNESVRENYGNKVTVEEKASEDSDKIEDEASEKLENKEIEDKMDDNTAIEVKENDE